MALLKMQPIKHKRVKKPLSSKLSSIAICWSFWFTVLCAVMLKYNLLIGSNYTFFSMNNFKKFLFFLPMFKFRSQFVVQE